MAPEPFLGTCPDRKASEGEGPASDDLDYDHPHNHDHPNDQNDPHNHDRPHDHDRPHNHNHPHDHNHHDDHHHHDPNALQPSFHELLGSVLGRSGAFLADDDQRPVQRRRLLPAR